MHTQREPTSFTPEGTLKRQRRLTPRSTARNSIVAKNVSATARYADFIIARLAANSSIAYSGARPVARFIGVSVPVFLKRLSCLVIVKWMRF